jgi:hypothetical protein
LAAPLPGEAARGPQGAGHRRGRNFVPIETIKDLTDEQLEAMIEYIETSLAAQAGAPPKMIDGTIEPKTVPATALPVLEPPKRKPNRLMIEVDTAIGPQERKPRKRVPSPAST